MLRKVVMAAIGIGAERRFGVSLDSRIDLLTQLLGVVDLYTGPEKYQYISLDI